MEVDKALQRTSNAVGFFLLTGEKTHKQTYLEYLDKTKQAVEVLKQAVRVQSSPALQQSVQKISEEVARFNSYREQIIHLAEIRNTKLSDIHVGEKSRIDSDLIKMQIGSLVESLSMQVDNLLQSQMQAAQTGSDKLIEKTTATTRLVSGLLVFGLIVSVVLSYGVTRLITAQLQVSVSALDDSADGEGDLIQRLDRYGQEEIAALAGGFHHFVAKIQDLMQQLSESVALLSESSASMSVSTALSRPMAENQYDETTQIVAALSERSAAHNDNDEGNQSRQVVNQVLHGGDRLGGDIEQTSEMILQLGQDIQAIGDVISMIRGITEQTNLLALNAGIEAARAGEQGRGYAVVADGVRCLADKIKYSTKEIQDKVENLQRHAQLALSRLLANRHAAHGKVESAAEASKSLEAISRAVTDITDMTREIATAAEEQSEVAEEVIQRVESVTGLANNVEGAAQQVSEGSQGLERLSDRLQKLVGRFKF